MHNEHNDQILPEEWKTASSDSKCALDFGCQIKIYEMSSTIHA